MLWETVTNLWDTIPNQLLWFGAATVLVALFWVVAAYNFYKAKPYEAVPDRQDGWVPTGRIDFSGPHPIGNYILQAEDTRLADSVGGVEHREIRWRKATLEETKAVVVAYHMQRNLAMTANFIVTSSIWRKPSELDHELQKAGLGNDEVSNGKSQGQTRSLVS
jgi:hypothetical protein